MIRTIANALLVAALAFAAPAYSSYNAFLKLSDVNGETTNSRPAAPGNSVKTNEAPKPAGKRLPTTQKAQEKPKPAAQKPRSAVGDVNGDSTANAKSKGNVDYGWKVERGER
jgi:hypothetical protein